MKKEVTLSVGFHCVRDGKDENKFTYRSPYILCLFRLGLAPGVCSRGLDESSNCRSALLSASGSTASTDLDIPRTPFDAFASECCLTSFTVDGVLVSGGDKSMGVRRASASSASCCAASNVETTAEVVVKAIIVEFKSSLAVPDVLNVSAIALYSEEIQYFSARLQLCSAVYVSALTAQVNVKCLNRPQSPPLPMTKLASALLENVSRRYIRR